MGSNKKSIISLLIFAVIAAGAYFAMTTLDVIDSTRVAPSTIEAQTAELERDIFVRVEQLNRVKLDNDFFSRESYKILQNINVELPQPRLSRPNPFADL